MIAPFTRRCSSCENLRNYQSENNTIEGTTFARRSFGGPRHFSALVFLRSRTQQLLLQRSQRLCHELYRFRSGRGILSKEFLLGDWSPDPLSIQFNRDLDGIGPGTLGRHCSVGEYSHDRLHDSIALLPTSISIEAVIDDKVERIIFFSPLVVMTIFCDRRGHFFSFCSFFRSSSIFFRRFVSLGNETFRWVKGARTFALD